MSDLAATNCGCGESNSCNSIIWILLILCCCSGNGLGGIGDGCGNDSSCLFIILILCCCGGFGNSGCGRSFC